MIEIDSSSPYENRKPIKPEVHNTLKRNSNTEEQAAISWQDLRESFVEDWKDDFDDNAKVKLGRGLKAINETLISDCQKSYDNQDNKSDTANITNEISKLHFPRIFNESSSRNSHEVPNVANMTKIVNIRNGVSDGNIRKNREPILTNMNTSGDEDLEAAEQKRTKHRIPRARRSAAAYRTFYEDLGQIQRDSYGTDGRSSSLFQLPDILEDQPDNVYLQRLTPNRNDDVQSFGEHAKRSRSADSRKKKKAGGSKKRRKKKKKQYTKTWERRSRKGGSLRSFSDGQRNRRHHAHGSAVSKSPSTRGRKPRKMKKTAASRTAGRIGDQESREMRLDAGMNERVLYENAVDRSVSEETIGDRARLN